MTSWTPHPTEDGSYTFFSEEFGETFHSTQGARTEAFHKFAEVTNLRQKAQKSTLRLLDICYGLGYNTAAALETIWSVNPSCCVEVYGLELDPTVPLSAITPDLLTGWSNLVQDILTDLAQVHHCKSDRLQAHLLLGDARQTLPTLIRQNWQADAIFFDPFSPRRCPQLWTVDFLRHVAKCLAPDGKLSTYSRSAAVRSALLEAGLSIGSIPLGANPEPHEWSQGTVAAWQPDLVLPLSPMEQEHLQTRAAIPYRDPHLNDTADNIVARHHQEQQQTTRESTSSWRRRWNIH